MNWEQTTLALGPFRRGFHLVTDRVTAGVPALRRFRLGVAHLFLLHCSASLTINENADPAVRSDLEYHFNRLVPDAAPQCQHTLEGPDDMSAHAKAALLGCALTIPVSDGRLRLGTWQGIYLCEHRNHAPTRELVVTIWGECG